MACTALNSRGDDFRYVDVLRWARCVAPAVCHALACDTDTKRHSLNLDPALLDIFSILVCHSTRTCEPRPVMHIGVLIAADVPLE